MAQAERVYFGSEADIPYKESPPIQFTYESTGSLTLGEYRWQDSPTLMIPNRALTDNSLIFIRSVTLSADITESDYVQNVPTLLDMPALFLYLQSEAGAVKWREPVIMSKFFNEFTHKFWFRPKQNRDRLQAAFRSINGRATLAQGSSLVGKASVTLKAVISAQEITDNNYIRAFENAYPAARGM